jgi:tetratricopeptide (TPR) repeat protein
MLALLALLYAQDPPPAEKRAEPTLDVDGEIISERRILEVMNEGSYLTTRRLSELWLVEHPESVVALYGLGKSLWEGEAKHPEAKHYLEKMLEIWKRDGYGADGNNTIYIDTLASLYLLCGEMGDHEAQFAYMDRYDLEVATPLGARRAWGLMKAGRIDEARALAEKGAASEQSGQRTAGLNTLCALNASYGSREDGYNACREALFWERTLSAADVTVAASNAALGALSVFKYEEAEEHYRESMTGGVSVSNPWKGMAGLYLREGRTEEALEMIRGAQKYRLSQPANYRAGDRAELDAFLATFLLALGESDKGMDLINRAIQFPDRRGLTSSTNVESVGGHALIRLVLRQVATERAAERRAAKPLWKRLPEQILSWLPDWDGWEDRETVAGILSDRELLLGTLMPHRDKSLASPSWLNGGLIPVLGTGVVSAGLNAAQLRETAPEGRAWLQAQAAEVAYLEGDEDEVRRLGSAALEGMPAGDRLMRARVQALLGAVSQDPTEQARLYTEAWRLHPGVFRLVGLALPARIESDGGAFAETVAAALRRSPRFTAANNAFVVTVSGNTDSVNACLLDPDNSRLVCTTLRPPPPKTPNPPADGASENNIPAQVEPPTEQEILEWMVDLFHRRAFGLPLGVNLHDVQSLDGTTVLMTEMRREKLENLLSELGGDQPELHSPAGE